MQPVWRWMEQLAFLLLFAGMVELALPSGEVRKAVRLLAALVVMLAVVEPFAGWLADPVGGLVPQGPGGSFLDAAAYIEAGEELAEAGAARALSLWTAQAGRELSAMLGLIDGVQRAEASVHLDARRGTPRVSVRLILEPDLAGEAGEARVVSRVKAFVVQLFPYMDAEAVDVWIGEQAAPLEGDRR